MTSTDENPLLGYSSIPEAKALTDESVPTSALGTWLSNISLVPDGNGVCSLATESGRDDPQPALDCLVDLC